MTEQLEYHIALNDAEIEGLDRRKWLIDYFDLYKTTLIWLAGLPPIPTCNLNKGEIRTQFHKTYRKILSDFDLEFDNENRSLSYLQ